MNKRVKIKEKGWEEKKDKNQEPCIKSHENFSNIKDI